MPGDNELVVKINGDPKGFNTAISETKASAKGFGDQLEAIAVPAAAAFAGLSTAIGYSLKQFADAEKIQAQLNATLEATKFAAGLTATEMTNLSEALSKVSTYDDEAILSAQNLLASFDNIGKQTFPDATKATLDLASKLQIDLSSAALILGKALQNPVDGLGGLSKAGVRFSDDEKKVLQALLDTGRAAEAQGIILQRLSTFSGGAAAAAVDTLSGAISQAKNEFNNAAEIIGGYFAPVVQEAAIRVKDLFILFQNNPKLIEFANRNLAAAFAVSGVFAAVAGALTVLTKLNSILGIVTITNGIAATSFRAIAGAAGIGILILAISLLITHWDEVQAATSAAMFGIYQSIQSIGGYIYDFVFNLLAAIGSLIAGQFQFTMDFIRNSISGFVNLFTKTGAEVSSAYAAGKIVGNNILMKANAETISIEQKQSAELARLNEVRRQEELKKYMGTADDITAIVDGKAVTVTGIESQLASDVISIYDDMGNGQLAEYDDASDQLINAARERADAIRAAESGGDSGGGGSSGGTFVGAGGGGGVGGGQSAIERLLTDSPEGRAARHALSKLPTYNPFTGRDDLRQWVYEYTQKAGIPFAKGFSGFTKDKIPARVSPGEIIVPENFAKGIRKGRYALTGANGRGGDGGRVRVDVGFRTVEASRVLTTQTNEDERLRVRRFLS